MDRLLILIPTALTLGLFVAGVPFVWWMIKTAYDEAENDVSAA